MKPLILTTKDKSIIPNHYIKRFQKYTSSYTITIYDDEDCKQFLLKEYGQVFLNKFNYIKLGCFKADLFRYAYLYKRGGLYMDIKTELFKDVDSIFPDPNICYLVGTVSTRSMLYNGIISTPPYNPYMFLLLQDMMSFNNDMPYGTPCINAMTILKYISKNERISYDGYIIPLSCFFPKVRMYKELFFNDCVKLDRHGFCSFICNYDGTRLIKTRDASYTGEF